MNTKTYVSLIIIVLAGIALYFMVRPSPVTTPASTAPINSMTYVCNLDKKINAEFYAGTPVAQTEGQPPVPTGSVKLTFENGNTMTLNQTISADGGRYANSDESFIFWSKGNGAMVLQNNEEKDYSERTAEAIDGEVSRLIKDAGVTAEKILTEKKDVLRKIVAELLEKETIEKEEFNKIVGIEPEQKNIEEK